MNRSIGEVYVIPLAYSTGYYEAKNGETPVGWGVYRQGDGFVESVYEHSLRPVASRYIYATRAEAIIKSCLAIPHKGIPND